MLITVPVIIIILVLFLVSPHEVFTALRTPGMIRIGNHIIYHLIFN